MKELTIEQKAKAYDEAYERAKEILECSKNSDSREVRIVLSFFPELKENEDERMVKFIKKQLFNIKKTITDNYKLDTEHTDAIAWLEKQGEQNPVNKVEPKFKVGDEIKTANEEPLTITKIDEKGYWSEDLFICGFGDAAKWELVGKSISKIDPKFHEGDWVVVSTIKGDRVVQIASVEYLKDGYPSYITTEGRWFGNGTKARLLTDKDVEIATIPESKIVVSKSKYWSEEDEDTLAAIIAIIRKQYNGTNIEEKKYYNVLINWLKSLKDRGKSQNMWKVVDKGIYVKEPALAQKKDKSEPGHGFVVCYDHTLTPDVYERYIMLSDINCHSWWKPSDKQITVLELASKYERVFTPKQIDILIGLKEQLKKLKGE